MELHNKLLPLIDFIKHGSMSLIMSSYDNFVISRGVGSCNNFTIEKFNKEERIIFDLFVLSRPQDKKIVESILGEQCIQVLLDNSVLFQKQNIIETLGISLRFFRGLSIFAGNGGYNRYVHFGYDTIRFIDAISFLSGDKTLELCSGGTSPSISLSKKCKEIVAVEICDLVHNIAKINISLNNINNIDIRLGNLWAPVKNELFNLIIANPPFSPSIEDPATDPAAIAGKDGLAVARKIWNEACNYLYPNGQLLMLLGMLGDEQHPFVLNELEQLAVLNHWHIEIIPIDFPKSISRMQIPSLQEESIDKRIFQIQDGGRKIGATHYHIALLRFYSGNPSVNYIPIHISAIKSFRKIKKND